MSNHRKTEVETRLKKFYETMNNAIALAETEQGMEIVDWTFPELKEMSPFMESYLLPHLSIVHIDTSGNSKICIASSTNYPVYYLADGSSFQFAYSGTVSLGKCQVRQILYDVNGDKGPNSYGKDIFAFHIAQNITYQYKKFSSYPTRIKYTNDTNISKCNQVIKNNFANLYYCTYLIQENGWKIPEDYPVKI